MHRLTFCAMPCACHNSRYFVQISQTNSLNYCSMFLSNSNNGRLLKERPHEIDLCFCCLPDLSVQKHMTWHRRIHFMFRPAGLLWTHNRGNQAKRIVPIVFFCQRLTNIYSFMSWWYEDIFVLGSWGMRDFSSLARKGRQMPIRIAINANSRDIHYVLRWSESRSTSATIARITLNASIRRPGLNDVTEDK